MSDPAFHDAYKIAPIIIVAYVFQGWMKYCDLGVFLANRTIHIAYAELFAAMVITIAYFTLIPLYGIHGAAWATVIGFAARFYWTNRKGKQYYDMKLPWSKVSMTALLALFAFSLSFLVPEESLLLSILIRGTIVILTTIVFFMLPILSRDEKSKVWEKAVNLKRVILS